MNPPPTPTRPDTLAAPVAAPYNDVWAAVNTLAHVLDTDMASAIARRAASEFLIHTFLGPVYHEVEARVLRDDPRRASVMESRTPKEEPHL